jgi:hypothetical protein
MKKYFIVASILLLAVSCNTKTAEVKNTNVEAQFGQGFRLEKDQTAHFKDSNVSFELLGFYNQPCPSGTQCFWSGQDVYYKIIDGDKTYSHKNLGDVTADGPYSLTVKDSDYTTYGNFVLNKKSGTSAELNTYTSPSKYGFSIKYPSDFIFTTSLAQLKPISYIPVCDEGTVACAYLTGDKYPGTNFDGAGVSINIDPALNTQTKCYNFKVSTNPAQNQQPDVAINGVVFKSATGGDAGAGHSEEVKVYRNFRNSWCYEISAHVGSTNIGNYEPGVVKQFDKNAVWEKLQGVVNSFKFTEPNNLSLSLKYDNSQYGFIFSLPIDWKDFTIITASWTGTDINDAGKQIGTGPIIKIRHPKWTSQVPYEDIPVMVFTLDQWKKVDANAMIVSAAPFGPSELSRNKKYVFALPPRYNYDYSLGYEEVEKIMEKSPLAGY